MSNLPALFAVINGGRGGRRRGQVSETVGILCRGRPCCYCQHALGGESFRVEKCVTSASTARRSRGTISPFNDSFLVRRHVYRIHEAQLLLYRLPPYFQYLTDPHERNRPHPDVATQVLGGAPACCACQGCPVRAFVPYVRMSVSRVSASLDHDRVALLLRVPGDVLRQGKLFTRHHG